MKKMSILLLAIFMSFSVFAQSADVITEILEADQATYGQVCYLSAVQQNLVADNSSYEDAINALHSEGQIGELIAPETEISAREAAALFASMWDIEGGLMFRLSKGAPRYAFKQLQADGIISSTKDPSEILSGSDILKMYTACVKKYSDFDIKTVSMEAE